MPANVVESVKSRFRTDLFGKINYQTAHVSNFDFVIEFAARYELALNSDKLKIDEVNGKKFRLPKGLLLFGKCGTGKTLAARILADRFGMTFIDTYTIALNYLKNTADGGDNWLETFLLGNSRKALVIDDVGAEGDIRRFGNESPMGSILSTRARFWEMYGTPTIYTSNLSSPSDIAAKYGNDDRLADRLRSYYIPVEFKGQSLRK